MNFWGERFDAYTDQGVVLDGNSHIELHRSVKSGKTQLLNGGKADVPPFVIQGDFVDDAFIIDFVRVFYRRAK